MRSVVCVRGEPDVFGGCSVCDGLSRLAGLGVSRQCAGRRGPKSRSRCRSPRGKRSRRHSRDHPARGSRLGGRLQIQLGIGRKLGTAARIAEVVRRPAMRKRTPARCLCVNRHATDRIDGCLGCVLRRWNRGRGRLWSWVRVCRTPGMRLRRHGHNLSTDPGEAQSLSARRHLAVFSCPGLHAAAGLHDAQATHPRPRF